MGYFIDVTPNNNSGEQNTQTNSTFNILPNCTLVIGDCICKIDSTTKQYIKANPHDKDFMPAVGIVVDKTSTTIDIQFFGKVNIPLSTGSNKPVFVGSDGRATVTVPSPTNHPNNFVLIQTVGCAISPTSMVFMPNFSMTKVIA